jgi:hypothetical protein
MVIFLGKTKTYDQQWVFYDETTGRPLSMRSTGLRSLGGDTNMVGVAGVTRQTGTRK